MHFWQHGSTALFLLFHFFDNHLQGSTKETQQERQKPDGSRQGRQEQKEEQKTQERRQNKTIDGGESVALWAESQSKSHCSQVHTLCACLSVCLCDVLGNY